MGNCRCCSKSIKILNKEGTCPSCGENPYICWNCKEEVAITEECIVCGFGYCQSCGECGPDCLAGVILEEINGKTDLEKIKIIFEYKMGKIRRHCKHLVGISYAKGRLRNMALKLKGYYIKKEDREMFEKRFEDILDLPLGKTWTVNDKKEKGFIGYEYRDSSNLAVCMGKAKKENKLSIKGNQYEQFVRVEKEPCEYINWNKLIVNKCPICKRLHNHTTETCGNFNCRYKSGERKGEMRKLKPIVSHCDFCDLPRKNFIKKGDDIDGEIS